MEKYGSSTGLVRRMQDAGADGQAARLGRAVAPGVLQPRRLLILLQNTGTCG